MLMSLLQGQLLDDGAERQRREEGEAADDDDDADHQPAEQRRVGGEGAGGRRCGCLRAIAPAMARTGMMRKNRPTNMAMPIVVSYHWVAVVRPANAEPLLLDAE